MVEGDGCLTLSGKKKGLDRGVMRPEIDRTWTYAE